MLQVARLAPDLLGEAGHHVVEFLQEQFNDDGGTRDRAGKSDLYYTVFGLEGLIAMRQEPPVEKVQPYLESFGDGEGLDLVHLACLARCWAALPDVTIDPDTARMLVGRIESFRSEDGGYNSKQGVPTGTVYHGFLSFGALQDLGITAPEPERLGRSIAATQIKGSTPTTAAAVTLLRQLRQPVPAVWGEWLLACAQPKGGFRATTDAPMPDVLSTATALHALAGMNVPFEHLKESTLDFLDTLWTGKAFCGNWADDEQDSEYTYYALLSMGHLSLA